MVSSPVWCWKKWFLWIKYIKGKDTEQDEEVLVLGKIELAFNINSPEDIISLENCGEIIEGEVMVEKEERNLIKGEEKVWSEIKGYQVATNNARILGELEELIINDRTGKITDVVIKVDKGRTVAVKGSKQKVTPYWCHSAKLKRWANLS